MILLKMLFNKKHEDARQKEFKVAKNSNEYEKNDITHHAVSDEEEQEQNMIPGNNGNFEPIQVGEYWDGGFIEQYLDLCKDERGFYIREHSWHYNAGQEREISVERIDVHWFINNSLRDFCDYIKKKHSRYEIEKYCIGNEKLASLFTKQDNIDKN